MDVFPFCRPLLSQTLMPRSHRFSHARARSPPGVERAHLDCTHTCTVEARPGSCRRRPPPRVMWRLRGGRPRQPAQLGPDGLRGSCEGAGRPVPSVGGGCLSLPAATAAWSPCSVGAQRRAPSGDPGTPLLGMPLADCRPAHSLAGRLSGA